MNLYEKIVKALEGETGISVPDAVEMQIARVGKFRSMAGRIVSITKEVLKSLAATDLTTLRPKAAKGHGPHATDAPSMGDILALRVDGDKLMATVKPSTAGAEAIRSGEFPERSIEYSEIDGVATFKGLALLGARPPAIVGMDPIPAFAGAPDSIVVMASAEEVVDLPDEVLDSPVKILNGDNDMSAEATALAEVTEKNKTLEARITRMAQFAGEDAKRFMDSEAIVKRVPLAMRKAGIVEFAVKLAELETTDANPTVKLAEGEKSLYASFKAFVSAMPEQIAATSTVEVARKGTEEIEAAKANLPAVLSEMTADPEGDEYLLAANAEIESSVKLGKPIDFAEAARRVYAKKGARR